MTFFTASSIAGRSASMPAVAICSTITAYNPEPGRPKSGFGGGMSGGFIRPDRLVTAMPASKLYA